VFLPGPDRAWASLVRGFTSGDLMAKTLGTLEHMAYGWLAASIVGIALGAMIGSSKTMRSYVAPSLEFLRPLPASAIIPKRSPSGPDAQLLGRRPLPVLSGSQVPLRSSLGELGGSG